MKTLFLHVRRMLSECYQSSENFKELEHCIEKQVLILELWQISDISIWLCSICCKLLPPENYIQLNCMCTKFLKHTYIFNNILIQIDSG